MLASVRILGLSLSLFNFPILIGAVHADDAPAPVGALGRAGAAFERLALDITAKAPTEVSDTPALHVVLRLDSRGALPQGGSGLLGDVKAALETGFTSDELTTTCELLKPSEAAGAVMSVDEARARMEQASADFLVSGDLLIEPRRTSVRLSFYTQGRRVVSKRVRVPTNTPDQNAQLAGNGHGGQGVAGQQAGNVPNGFAGGNGFGGGNAVAGGGGFAAGGAGAAGVACNIGEQIATRTEMMGQPGVPFTFSGVSALENCEPGTADVVNSNQSNDSLGFACMLAGDAGSTVDTATTAPTELNSDVLEFAEERLGMQVGNGECWTLAAEALIAADAEPAWYYDFGDEIPLDEVAPGDILQFKRARFEDGSGMYILMGIPNHTAIVRATNGTEVTVLHQNFGQRIVTELTFDLADLVEGEMWAFRPVPNEDADQTASE